MPAQNASGPFEAARERYARLGVDVEEALAAADALPISIHCWQGDDVGGFESPGAGLSGGGIQVTGNYPGKATTIGELRDDLEAALSLVPGTKRLSLHASYGEFGGRKVDRDALEPEHFQGWIGWAGERKLKLDFNATLFSHPLAAAGATLSSADSRIRAFWVEHVKRARRVAAAMGRAQASPSVHNTWIPDGSKDVTFDRGGARARLLESLDAIFAEELPGSQIEDALEGKLFGIGSESFVVGSHEFYLGYAVARRKFVTLDMGHYHPTESVADKISSILPFVPGILVHVSRGVRWDSDHVVLLTDELVDFAREVVRARPEGRIRLGLDYFDGSINRVGAWATGARATRKAFLMAYLDPRKAQLEAEASGDGFRRLALLEEAKGLPWAAVWDEYCRRSGVADEAALYESVKAYEARVLPARKGR